MDGGRGFNTALGTGFGVEIWQGGGAIGGGRCFGMEVGMGQGAGLRHVGGVIGGGQAYWGWGGGDGCNAGGVAWRAEMLWGRGLLGLAKRDGGVAYGGRGHR